MQLLCERNVYTVFSGCPAAILNKVPDALPPAEVVPYRFPLLSRITPASGNAPSARPVNAARRKNE